MTVIDDAANARQERFFERETAAAAVRVFSLRIKGYGIPEALYCGKENAFALTRKPADAEPSAGITEPKSRFGRARGKPGVDVTAADSPQAKGRVERNRGIDRDRLVKELRLAGISTVAEANQFPEKTCLPKMNKKFSRPPAEEADARSPLGNANLKDILCFGHERTVGNDYVIRFEKRLFQILKPNKTLPRPKDKALIRILLDGGLSILWKETKLLVKELTNIQDQKIQQAA
jgi:hypothetical protein